MPQKSDLYFAELANKTGADALKHGDYPCGCLITRNDKIVTKAHSQEHNKYDVTAHAEIIAISRACRKLRTNNLSEYTLYTNIEPCLMCAQAIIYAGIKKAVYGTEHREYGKRKTFDILKAYGIGKSVKVKGGIGGKRAKELLDKFLKRKFVARSQ